jgi:hypothetical protein
MKTDRFRVLMAFEHPIIEDKQTSSFAPMLDLISTLEQCEELNNNIVDPIALLWLTKEEVEFYRLNKT